MKDIKCEQHDVLKSFMSKIKSFRTTLYNKNKI